MKLYTVIPIARGVGKETLHYFGPDTIDTGSLVSIPIRSKAGRGIVIDKQDVSEAKTDIKSARFQLKKILRVESKHFLSKAFLEAAFETAQFFATTTGSVLQTTIPELIFESAKNIQRNFLDSPAKEIGTRERLIIQADDDERFAHYKSFIRGEFAKRKSVFFCLPTIEDIRHAKKLLEKGIEQYTVTLYSSMSKKEFLKALELVENAPHPVLIIGTVPFLSVERKDLGSIILDKENSRGYRTQFRPYVDLRVFVAHLAKAKNALLLCGDLMLSIETLWHYKNDDYAEFMPLKMRLLSPASQMIIDMKSETGGDKKFRILSPELEEMLMLSRTSNEKMFVFAARKGLAPSIVCGDCGTVVTCNNCRSPIALYGQEKREPMFMCNKCGLERSSMERCKHCNSWKLQTLGIGIEKVEEEIKALLPESTVLRIDKESVKTEKKALEIMEKFENTPGSILIGTELGLFYLKNPIENVAVATIDSLFSVPDFRINEKIFYLLLTMRSRAQSRFLIQTRNASERVLEYAIKGNLADFYRLEIEDRKRFSYPPFSLFIKMTLEGKGVSLEKAAEDTVEILKEFSPRVYSGLALSPKGNSLIHILLRRTPEKWPDDQLLEILRRLPPQISVRVDPESLL